MYSNILAGKPEGKRPLGRPRRRWVDNIRTDLQEVGCEYMDWIGLAQDRDRWRTLESAVMNLRVPWNAGNFLTSCKPVSFSRRTLHHAVSKYVMYSNIMWKSVNLILASSRLICPNVQRRRRTPNQGILDPMSSAARYTTTNPVNWPRDATSTLTVSSRGGTQLAHSRFVTSDGGTPPETGGRPPVPRRLWEICRRDDRHRLVIISENECSVRC